MVDGHGTTGIEDVEGVTTDAEDGTIGVERWAWHDVVVNGKVYDRLGLGLDVRQTRLWSRCTTD